MSAFPKLFEVESFGASGVSQIWTNQSVHKNYPPMLMAIPTEFEGPGGAYSPEDLYALSLMNCYLATFKYIAEKSKLQYRNIYGKAILHVDKADQPAPWMHKIDLKFTLIDVPQPDRARAMMEKVVAHCMILNSVKTELNFSFSIE
jgi:organic hydroperoxide reductase OsmC/OhrA